MLSDFAPAKINLYLHILNRRPDGYHALESLVAFADIGDRLTLDPSKPLSLNITGPFAKDCGEAERNSILKAARALQLRAPDLKLGAFSLEKNLPVAAGLGGGSADAAACLRLLAEANAIPHDSKLIADTALYTGADVPVCLKSAAALMRGVGEEVSAVSLPPIDAIFVNCGKPLLTREVFEKFSLQAAKAEEDFSVVQNVFELIDLLKTKTNDLTEAASMLCPDIKQVARALEDSGALLTRLSGSGATVFGLYKDRALAVEAAQVLRRDHSHWWIQATTLR